MPRIELLDVPYYSPTDPYFWEYDNLPLKAIVRRLDLVNYSVDNVIEQITEAIGTQGTISNRLAQSINPDGSLKSTAIDEALHSIEEHEDTDDYMRMTRAQSEKLDLIADEATDVVIQIDDGTTVTTLDSGTVIFEATDSVEIELEAPNIVKFNLGFPVEAAHQHYYEVTPVHADTLDPDYINYQTTSTPTVFVEDTLRVFINGVRLCSTAEIYVPGSLVDDPWTLISFTPDAENGLFTLSAAITEDDIIRIDFDTSFV